MKAATRINIALTMLLIATGAGSGGIETVLAAATCDEQRCCDEYDTGYTYTCVQWTEGGDPVENADFAFNFSDPDRPDIVLISGAEWTVWGQESVEDTDPDSLGDVYINPAFESSDDFTVTIENANTSGAGATTLVSIVLDDTDWTGGSNIDGLTVTGSVNGTIKVAVDSGGGEGDISGALDIDGDLNGDLIVEHDISAAVSIDGDVDGAITVGNDVSAAVTIGTAGADGVVSGAISIGNDLSGALTIYSDVQSSFTVTGDITVSSYLGPYSTGPALVGPVTIGAVKALLLIAGDYGHASTAKNITITEISNSASFWISGDVLGPSQMTITNLGVEGGNPCGAGEGSGGTFKVAGNVEDENAVLEITNMAAVDGKSSSVNINSFYSDLFAGTINLKDGVPECPGGSLDNSVTIIGQLQGTDAVGVVDLFNQDINGSLILGSADSGATVIRGGEVGGTFYPSQFEGDFAGTATVGKVNAGGSVYAFDSNDHAAIISGTVTIDGDLDGLARVDGNLTGTLNINGQVSTHSGLDGLVWITHRVDGAVDIDDDVIGHVHFQNLLSGSGSLVIGGDVTGEIVIGDEDDVEGDTAGDITIALDLESGGLIDLHDAYVGMLNIQGNLVGDIDLANDLEGTIDLDGAASGDVDINGDVSGTVSIGGIFSNGGTIQLTGALTSAGEIIVTGECRGDVIIGRSTAAGSLIHFPGGINGTGSLTINQSEGAYAAAGDITVGTLSGDAADETHMDGNITILDDSVTFCVYTGSSAGAGDLDGTLRIAVCDDDAYDHNVCIEGDVNGTIDIDESGCEDPPGAGIACLACSS